MMIFDNDGNVLASTGLLHGETPLLPPGMLQYTRGQGEDRITWQPENGVRIASVVVHVEGMNSGFILAGRSLRDTEERIDQMGMLVTAGFAASLVATFAAVIVCEWIFHSAKKD
jgi:hypothetical protein